MNFKKALMFATVLLAMVFASSIALADNHTNSTNTTVNTTVNGTTNVTVNETGNMTVNETNNTDNNVSMNETGNMTTNTSTNVTMNETNVSMNDTNTSMNETNMTVNETDGNLSVNETGNMTDGNTTTNETDRNVTDNQTGLEDFGQIKNAFLAGELSEEELRSLIANNRFPPGILNVLLKSGQLSQETIDVILENQDMPKGILDKFLGFFGIERNSLISNLVDYNNLSADNVESLVTNFDVPDKDLKKAVKGKKFKPDQAQRITQKLEESGNEDIVQEVLTRTLPPQAKARNAGSLDIGSQSKGNGRTAQIREKVENSIDKVPPGQAKKSDQSPIDRRGPPANVGNTGNDVQESEDSQRRGPPSGVGPNRDDENTPPGLAKKPTTPGDNPGKGRGRN